MTAQLRKSLSIVLLVAMLALTGLSAAAQDQPLILDDDARYVEVDGVNLYVIERGPLNGVPVILQHGFGGSVFTWRYLLTPLANAGFRAIAFDRPPYGLSDKRPEAMDYTGQGYADLTVGLMDALEIERAVLIGHSAGGGVIANTVALYPERVSGLVFVAGAVRTGDPVADAWATASDESRGGFSALASTLASVNPNNPLAQAAVRAVFTPERFAEIVTSTYYDPSVMPADAAEGYARPLLVSGWEGALLKIFTSPMPVEMYQPEDLAALEIPVLLMWGEDDTWVSFNVGQALGALIPGSEMISYPLTGHMPMEEHVEQFNADLIAWLSEYFPAAN